MFLRGVVVCRFMLVLITTARISVFTLGVIVTLGVPATTKIFIFIDPALVQVTVIFLCSR